MATDQQVRRLHRRDRAGDTKTQAAARAGMDAKTARKYRLSNRLPSEVRMDHTWRTRPDPFLRTRERPRSAAGSRRHSAEA